MSDWTSGYVADIGYTFGYYTELNPLRVRLAFANAGLVCPDVVTACELGFGQGVSINVHAAASTTQWFGTDFNPGQAGFAQELAKASGANVRVFDDSFLEFANRDDLPEFDYIGLHGIWSWISDENRAVIVDFVRRKLKVGGVLYVSYNTLPGWSGFAPMRHLLTEHARHLGAEGQGIVNRIENAIGFSEAMLATNPAYVKAYSQAGARLQKVKEASRQYLAHEYFNRDWHPMYFSTMCEWLQQAKLSYACSASMIDHVDLLNLTADQQKFLKSIPDRMFRETVRDFMVNQQFRRDFWVKGPRSLTSAEREEHLSRIRFMLVVPAADIPLKVNGGLGELKLKDEIYKPMLGVLADHKPRTLPELARELEGQNIHEAQLMEAVLIIAGLGHVALVQDDETVERALGPTQLLNRHLLEKARSSSDIVHLAAPATGGAVQVGRFQQLFLLALHNGHTTADDWARFAWQVLKSQGQRIVKGGSALATDDENLNELTRQAGEFEVKNLPALKALRTV